MYIVLLFKTSKMNGQLMGFPQLVQKLEWITPIISTLEDNQNEWSIYGFSSTGSKVRSNNTTNPFYQSLISIYGFSSAKSR